MSARRRFGAVIVNYNCAPLALDAALSVLGAARGDARVVIVDNASPDGSARYFRAAFEGTRAHRPKAPAGGPTSVRFADLDSTAAAICDASAPLPDACDLVVLAALENRGFAAGCNIGLKALQSLGRTEFFLLLNPDALVAEGALDAFAARLGGSDAGLCGASVLTFDAPHLVQALGGAALDPWTLQGANLGAGLRLGEAPHTEQIERRLSYPLGAAIACRPDYVERAGFLDERYFLYYEEADWTFAGGGRRPAWAREAVVYHRYGGSSKSRTPNAGAASQRSPLAEYHMARSRILFALKWRPHLAPLLALIGVVQAARRLARGRAGAARAVALGSLPGAARSFSAPR